MISVVLATYNEAKNIKRCLDSVKDWADEIVIVDGQSTDNTQELAESLGARVISTTNKPIFHINKQMAMDEAQGQLVLQLDADEEVDEHLASFIKKTHKKLINYQKSSEKTKKLQDFEPKAWWLKRKNLFLGKFLTKGGQYPDPVIRLYVNGFARLPQKSVHEQMEVDGQVGWADGHLVHHSNPSFKDYLRKFNAYTSLEAQALYDQGQRHGWRTFLSLWFWKPTWTFLNLFVRHKGFLDKGPGFIFALMSGLHYPVTYLKLWELSTTNEKTSS